MKKNKVKYIPFQYEKTKYSEHRINVFYTNRGIYFFYFFCKYDPLFRKTLVKNILFLSFGQKK